MPVMSGIKARLVENLAEFTAALEAAKRGLGIPPWMSEAEAIAWCEAKVAELTAEVAKI